MPSNDGPSSTNSSMSDETPAIKRDQSEAELPLLPPKRPRSKSKLPVTPVPRSQKAPGELLTAEEKKANHIASEQKRRQAIREGFDKITSIVPNLDSSQGRSEAVVLTQTVKFLRKLLEENKALKEVADQHKIEVSDDLIAENDTT